MRLIDADALIKTIECADCVGGWNPIIQLIHFAPTIESVPVRRGHWVKVSGYCTPGGDPVWRCSECGKGVHVYGIEHGTYGADVSDGQWVACPNCGADMRGESDE